MTPIYYLDKLSTKNHCNVIIQAFWDVMQTSNPNRNLCPFKIQFWILIKWLTRKVPSAKQAPEGTSLEKWRVQYSSIIKNFASTSLLAVRDAVTPWASLCSCSSLCAHLQMYMCAQTHIYAGSEEEVWYRVATWGTSFPYVPMWKSKNKSCSTKIITKFE